MMQLLASLPAFVAIRQGWPSFLLQMPFDQAPQTAQMGSPLCQAIWCDLHHCLDAANRASGLHTPRNHRLHSSSRRYCPQTLHVSQPSTCSIVCWLSATTSVKGRWGFYASMFDLHLFPEVLQHSHQVSLYLLGQSIDVRHLSDDTGAELVRPGPFPSELVGHLVGNVALNAHVAFLDLLGLVAGNLDDCELACPMRQGVPKLLPKMSVNSVQGPLFQPKGVDNILVVDIDSEISCCAPRCS